MLLLKQIIYLDPEVKKENTNKEGVSEQDSQELETVLENTELQVITDLMDKSNIDGKIITSQKVDKNNNPIFNTEVWDIRTEVKTEIISDNKLTKLLDNAQSVLDKKSDYLRNNSEFLTVFSELADRFSKNITSEDQLKSVLWDSGYNRESLSDWEISHLFNVLETGQGWNREKVKVLQLIMIKLNDQFHDILNQNGGIDGLAGEKTLEVLDQFLNQLKMKSEVWKTLDIKPIIALIPNEIDSHLEKTKPEEVREVVFPDTSKWSPFSGRINITKHNFDKAESENQTTAEHNLWISDQIADRVYDSDKAFDIAFNQNNWNSWMAVQLNSEWFLNEIKNKKDNKILENEFKEIMENSINFVNKYVNDNQMNEGEELNFELRPLINKEKNPIKFRVKRDGNFIKVYMNDSDTPIWMRIRKGSAKISAQVWFWANWTPSTNREFKNAKYIGIKGEIKKPISKNISATASGEVGYGSAITPENPMRDWWWGKATLWFEFRNNENTLKTNLGGSVILDKYSPYNRNHMIFGVEGNVTFNPNDKLNLYGDASRNQVQWISGGLNAKYKINDKRTANTGMNYNQGINLPGTLTSQNQLAVKAWIENKNIALNLVAWKSLYNLNTNPYNVWATVSIKF